MRIGTRTLLFGAHHIVLHPILVLVAWVRLYKGLPSWREIVCIVIHDWGYWGKADLDGEQGEFHPLWAAGRVRGWGKYYYDFVAYHSRFMAGKHAEQISRLCLPDKVGVALYPVWLWALLAHLSGEWQEYRALKKYNDGLDRQSARGFFKGYQRLAKLWAETHNPYLDMEALLYMQSFHAGQLLVPYRAMRVLAQGLDPCSFCGGQARLESQPHDELDTEWFVVCNSCAAQGPWMKSETGARTLWNMRHKPEANADE